MNDVSAVSTPNLDSLITNLAELIRLGGTETKITGRVAERLTEALAAGLELPDSMTAPHPDHYVMYPLYVAPDGSFSIASAVWNVGQETPVHDHGVWGVVGIHSGVERELRYAPSTHPDAGALSKLDEADWQPGQVTVCCTTDADLHQVACASDVPCVGLHVYGGDIGRIRRRSYDPTSGAVSYFVSQWAEPAH